MMIGSTSFILYLIASIVNFSALILILVLLFNRKKMDFSPLDQRFTDLEKLSTRLDKSVNERFLEYRTEDNKNASSLRKELTDSILAFGKATDDRMTNVASLQKGQLETFSRVLNENLETSARKIQTLNEEFEKQQEALRSKLDNKLSELRDENNKKLDEIRKTVDEKLQSALEKRLGEAFKQVSDRLEKVHEGLGEMKNLATGVGDLKRVLTNVKTRGTWGEVVLEDLLSDMLTPDQFEKNAATRPNSGERVEFAVKLPGATSGGGPVLIPIDSKFPKEDYEKIIAASEVGDVRSVDNATKKLESAIKNFAKEIKAKYINPPHTTDFAIMFLPTEGLYAEVLRKPGFVEVIQREHRVTIAGPTTFSAMLRALQMGFRTLAIEKQTSQVWETLGAVKTEFEKFGDVLNKVKRKLVEASNQLDLVDVRTRALDRKLKDVEQLPDEAASEVLRLSTHIGSASITDTDPAE